MELTLHFLVLREINFVFVNHGIPGFTWKIYLQNPYLNANKAMKYKENIREVMY